MQYDAGDVIYDYSRAFIRTIIKKRTIIGISFALFDPLKNLSALSRIKLFPRTSAVVSL